MLNKLLSAIIFVAMLPIYATAYLIINHVPNLDGMEDLSKEDIF